VSRWVETRLKWVTSLAGGGTPSVGESTYWADDGGGTPWVTIGDMTRERVVSSTSRRVSKAGLEATRLHIGPPGTILFAMYASVGETAVLGCSAAWNQAIVGMEPITDRADARFLYYWLQHLRPQLPAWFRSNTQDNLNAEQVGSLPFPVVPIAKQRTIAGFLDRETARIDGLISRKRGLIDLLRMRLWESRTRLVLGLDGESVAHPVLGRVRKRWRVMRLRHVVPRIGVGLVINPSSYFSETGIPFIHGANVREGWIKTSNMKFMSEQSSRTLSQSRLSAGDVVVVRAGYPGRAAVVTEDLHGANCASILILRKGHLVLPEYLAAFFNSGAARSQVLAAQYDAAQEQVNVSHVVDFSMPVPARHEQEELVQQIGKEQEVTNYLVSRSERQLELLQEHRQALITAAVTGQLDLPEAA
jgi:type I restriction enzyme S subunit